MPPRKGAQTVHVTLSTDAMEVLDRLAAATATGNKSLLIQGLLLRQAAGEESGQLSPTLAAFEQRVCILADTMSRQLSAMTTAATQASTAVTTV